MLDTGLAGLSSVFLDQTQMLTYIHTFTSSSVLPSTGSCLSGERRAFRRAKRAIPEVLLLSGINILFTCGRSAHKRSAWMGIVTPGGLRAAFHGL